MGPPPWSAEEQVAGVAEVQWHIQTVDCPKLASFYRRDRIHPGSVVGDICVMEAPMRDAITGIGLVAFGAIAVLALCIGVCALADAVMRVVA